jgi:hypothetical protein
MVQTQALLTAVLALAGPTPPAEPSSEPPAEVPPSPGDYLRFEHPVVTNPYQPLAPPPPYKGTPSRRGGGGGGGGGGGMGQNPATLADTAQLAGVTRGANGGLGQTLPAGWAETPTTPTSPTGPTDPPTEPTMWLELVDDPSATPGASPVFADDPAGGEPPTPNPEPGTLVLAGIGLTVGGGAVVRKWRRKKS